MKKSFLLLMGVIVLAACIKSNVKNDGTSQLDSAVIDDGSSTSVPSVYGQTDSTFNVNGKVFKVNVKQFDLTYLATSNGDTLSRPTYTCAIRIFDSENKMVLKDSLLRDSWGYEGKIAPIDAYQISLPHFNFSDNQIFFCFYIYESDSEDEIEGCIAFNIVTNKPRYFWQESTAGD